VDRRTKEENGDIMRISKIASKKHEEAVELALSGKELTFDEKWQILNDYNAAANHLISKNAAFFTPPAIAKEMIIECIDKPKKRILDLGAGIGCISFFINEQQKIWGKENEIEIICLELNADYIEIGKSIIPEATWIHGDMFDQDLIKSLGKFDEVVSNPPYGIIQKTNWLNLNLSQYTAAEIAMKVSNHGVFLLAQNDCPFKYSGNKSFEKVYCKRYDKFHKDTGIYFHMNCGIDLNPKMNKEYIFKNLNKNMLFEIVILSNEKE
jgi:predicted RNA methylase